MLTLPLALAAITAGVAGGVHCIGMCGGISTLLNQAGIRREKIIPIHADNAVRDASRVSSLAVNRSSLSFQLLLQSGRISTYMLVGALFGGLGNAGLILRPYLPAQQFLFVFGNLALVALGIRVLGVTVPFQWLSHFFSTWQQRFFSKLPSLKNGIRYPFLTGLAWGCLPCGLLYSVIPFALLSGDWFAGAMLMLLFGLSALPHLLFSQGLFAIANRGHVPAWLRNMGGVTLISIGALGLWYFDMHQMPSFLCVIPAT
ncbi:sulfite exporter TauE/SafE family protein [Undibacterium sp. RuRC25W]|uniref:sulfite exporter TauE/SafE family protein n=1 Tax=Undibacterium sp. RuRC25W TaxID=3413047 RepID=UPI003BF0CDB4